MNVTPYLNFDGRCEEALNFYKKAVGAEVGMLMRYKDSPEPCPGEKPPADKIMHTAFRLGDTTVMASDCHCKGKPAFQGISLSINANDDAQANKIFGAMSDGGQVAAPISKTFFASSFGVVTDRFGVTWMIIVEPKT
jgi:PhnB protein